MNRTTFSKCLAHWRCDDFTASLELEIESLPSGILPLHKAVTPGSYVDDSDMACTILRVTETDNVIQARVGIFFTEIVVSCGCGDEPMHQNAYTEMDIHIDKHSAEVEFEIVCD